MPEKKYTTSQTHLLGELEMLLFYPDGQAFTSYNQEKQRAKRLANKLR
ncbi:MAG: hypothetical protein IM466_08145 [Microcystis sp. M04BS1]|nr:hypothetical protein [Microcystis sp. M04BS1]